MERLNQRLVDRLQAERSPERRVAIAGFPAQVGSLRQPLTEFVQEAFGGTRLDPAPFLRGVYFASGTQEGTPIDRLTGALARGFGIDQQRAPSLRPEAGKSYFLTRLLKDVIFGEAMLVSRDPAAVQTRLDDAARCRKSGRARCPGGRGRVDPDPVGQQERDRPGEHGGRRLCRGREGVAAGPGQRCRLRQGRAGVEHGARVAVRRANAGDRNAVVPGPVADRKTRRRRRPDLCQRAEQHLPAAPAVAAGRTDAARITDAPFLYEATRTYLMLGSAGPMDRPSIKEWMRLDWPAAFPGPLGQPLRDSLGTHLDALLNQPLPQVALDGALVDEARRTFSRVSLAQRVYQVIRRSPETSALAPWVPADAAGRRRCDTVHPSFRRETDRWAVRLLHRGGVLSRRIAADATRAVGDRQRQLGTGQTVRVQRVSPQAATLQRDVVKLYTDEYAANWDGFIAELDLPPLTDSQQSMQTLYVLSSPQSPMRDMLTAITKQLLLGLRRHRSRRAAAGVAQAAGGGGGGGGRKCHGTTAEFVGRTEAHRPNPLPAKRSRIVTTR